MTQNEIIERINQQVIDGLEIKGLKYFKPSKYFNNRYIKYANGGIIDEDPP